MKIRRGFVSNSSSSSFLIYGVEIDQGELVKLLCAKTGKTEEDYEEDLLWAAEKELKGLSAHHPFYDTNYYIGQSWSAVKDDETGKEFKARVEEAVEKALGKKLKCSTHSAAWRDG